jgi:CCR4-NOT transcription complex subunit 1
MWLGLLTFAKNKPVLAKDMDLKALIQDAYTRGRMIAVLPFVEKVLAGCKDTKVRVCGGVGGVLTHRARAGEALS